MSNPNDFFPKIKTRSPNETELRVRIRELERDLYFERQGVCGLALELGRIDEEKRLLLMRLRETSALH